MGGFDSPRLRRLIERPAGDPHAPPSPGGENGATAPSSGAEIVTASGTTLGTAGRVSGRVSGPESSTERCELCAEAIPPEHRHLFELSTRELQCVCQACRLLFERPAAGGDRYRLVPDRRWYVVDFDLADPVWASLSIPVDMAFFCYSSAAERMVAYYPSPAGPTESLLELTAWEEIAAANPVLAEMADDVEALLVNRAKGARDHLLAPIDDCYSLVGLIRTQWQGLSGGDAVWSEIDGFFADLRQGARHVHRDGTRQRSGGKS